MRKVFFIALILTWSAMYGFATEPSGEQLLWQKGNNFYQQKQYDSAAYYYEQIASLKPRNREVYYNLGNTYYRLNKIAPAILNYQRALKIDPEYKDAQDNLALAQNRIIGHIPVAPDIFFVRWWNEITRPGNTAAWSVAAFMAFFLFIAVMLVRRLKKPGHKTVPVQLQGFLLFLFICFLSLAFFSAQN